MSKLGHIAMRNADLVSWQKRQLPFLQTAPPTAIGSGHVTMLAYLFFDDIQFDQYWDVLECSIRETWLHCGLMKTVIVTNRAMPRLEKFSAVFSGWVKLDVTTDLVPGSLWSMSVDCIRNLHRRFDTEHVLIVQTDGFPIRSGLEAFVGKWDFIGAPYVRNQWWKQAVCRVMNCWVSNGGFSLRSRHICEQAAFYWQKRYSELPDCRSKSEDIFYTEFLPLHERAYRRSVRIAGYEDALAFSYDAVFPYPKKSPPFGFHGADAFGILRQAGWVPDGVSQQG